MFDSVASVAMRSALDALALRQRVIADNVANINTPDYRAKRVAFEESLARAVEQGSRAVANTSPAVRESLEPTRTDGNNVNLDAETLHNIDTVLRYQVATRAIDGTFSALRTAMRTS